VKRETAILNTYEPGPPFRSLAVPIHRGSTILFDTVAEFGARHISSSDSYSYGLYGHPASRALEQAIAALEGGGQTVLTPSGMSAITLVNLTALKSGDEVLIPVSAYGPAQQAAKTLLADLGVCVRFYQPDADIAPLLSDRTRLVWFEAPGSFGMEMQDVRAIVASAHTAGAEVAADATWASPLGFDAMGHRIDYAVQALSKYVCGHSDVLMGAVTVGDKKRFKRLRDRRRALGYGVSPDDCYLTLRGLETLAVRIERQSRTAIWLADWLRDQIGVERVLHPALPGDAGHRFWSRDFTGAGSVFSIVLEKSHAQNLPNFLENLSVFRIGASWGGVHSLVAPADMQALRPGAEWADSGPLVRIGVGLEDADDLRSDLAEGLRRYLGAHQHAAE
jgi:cystathionine beta-lyase